MEGWCIIGVVNCIRIHSGAVIWTDSAQLDDDGVLTAVAPNFLELPGQPLILAAPRITEFHLRWRRRLSDIDLSVDQLREGEVVLAEHLGSCQDIAIPEETFWHVCWSEILQSTCIFEFTPQASSGQRVRNVRSIVSQPLEPEDQAALQSLIDSAASPAEIDLAAFGRTLLESQRRTLGPPSATGRRYYRVGGYVTQTEISQAGIHHDHILHWSDRIGVQIDPFSLNPVL
jgi:hypothetical protein